MYIVNNIDIQNNTSNVTSFVHTTSKKHTYDDFFTLIVMECIAQY